MGSSSSILGDRFHEIRLKYFNKKILLKALTFLFRCQFPFWELKNLFPTSMNSGSSITRELYGSTDEFSYRITIDTGFEVIINISEKSAKQQTSLKLNKSGSNFYSKCISAFAINDVLGDLSLRDSFSQILHQLSQWIDWLQRSKSLPLSWTFRCGLQILGASSWITRIASRLLCHHSACWTFSRNHQKHLKSSKHQWYLISHFVFSPLCLEFRSKSNSGNH